MTSAQQPLVSIITPVYNDARFIARCIESVLAQSYTNWDYTIVNNCSTDSSGEIARDYAAKDPRIRVHDNTEFLSALRNHNTAIQQLSPQSKYCKLLFSDDWLFPNCIADMVGLAELHPSIGVVGAYGLQGSEVLWSGLPYPSSVLSGRDVCRKFFLDGLYVFGSATSVLYRSDLVRNHDPFYNESNIHSDMESCIALLSECDFGFVHQILTYRRVWTGSMSTFTDDLYSLLGGRLYALVTYGPRFLSEEEYSCCIENYLSEYYNFLAVSFMRLSRSGEFWEFHKKQLHLSGFELDRLRLMGAAVRRFCRAILNPNESIEKLGKFRRHEAERPKSSGGLSHASEKQ